MHVGPAPVEGPARQVSPEALRLTDDQRGTPSNHIAIWL
jgi:hypothetical protein